MLPVIVDSLLNLAIQFSDDVLSLVMETLAMVLAVSFCFSSQPVICLKNNFTYFFR